MKKIMYGLGCAVFALLGFSCGQNKTITTSDELTRDSSYTEVIHPEWSRNAVIYEVNLRQYTPEGTIKAFESHLPRLKELGVDILWFMPIHPISELNRKGELGSYYAVRDYKGVNPEFGTIDDFKQLVNAAHKAGMKVIIDWVPNHSGCDNAWVTEHPEWYARDEKGDFVAPYDWTDVYKFDYSNQEFRAAMVDALQYWVRDVNIDGYRCDVAGEVPTDFWNDLRPALDSIKPVFMLAEASKPELNKKGFDMSYNWPMKDLFNEISRSQGQNSWKLGEGQVAPVKTALAIDSLLAVQAVDYPQDSYMMNMITNHDLNTWEGTEFERYGKAVDAFAVLTYTLPGMPLIYTGQETGMNRAFEFFKKDKSPDWTKNKYFEFYKKLNELKHSQSALAAGSAGAKMERYLTDNPNTYIFSRIDEKGGVLVYINLNDTEVKLNYSDKTPEAKSAVNYFNGTTTDELPTTLKAWEYVVFTL